MDYQKCRVLLELAKTENITKTAERLGYSQPGMSHMLKNIEKELGFTVVFREKYGVKLTPAAQQLLPVIKEVSETYQKLEESINSIRELENAQLTIGTYQSVASHLLPKILHEFMQQHPGVQMNIREGNITNIRDWIMKDEIDLAFISRSYADGLEFLSYGEDPLVAVFPENYPVKAKDGFPIEQFENQSFILLAEKRGYDLHSVLEEYNVKLNVKYSVLDDHTILSMVENEMGVSILSKLLTKGTDHRVQLIPLKPACARELGIAMKSYDDLSPAAKKFTDLCMQRISRLLDKVVNES